MYTPRQFGAVDVGTVAGAVQNPIGTGVNFLLKGVTSLFGTGDVSAYQDMIVQLAMKLAAQGNLSALEVLAGFSGRYGAVSVLDKLGVLHAMQALRPDQAAALANTFGGGNDPHPNLAGPLARVGTQDLAWRAFQTLLQSAGVAVPPPNQYQTNTPGRIGNLGNPTILPLSWPPSAAGGSVPVVVGPGSATGGTGIPIDSGTSFIPDGASSGGAVVPTRATSAVPWLLGLGLVGAVLVGGRGRGRRR